MCVALASTNANVFNVTPCSSFQYRIDRPKKCNQSLAAPSNLIATNALAMESFNICFSSFAFLSTMSRAA